MKNIRIESTTLSESLLQAIATRDAVLWVGSGVDDSSINVQHLRSLMGLPWKLVVSEANGSQLIEALELQENADSRLLRTRGFIHLVAADPEGTILPPRALPIFFPNGRKNAHRPEESTQLGAMAGMRRRLNMLGEIVSARPRVLLMVSNGREQPLQDFFSLWSEGFRSLVAVISESDHDAERLDEWLKEPGAAAAVDYCRSALATAVPDIIDRLTIELPEDRLVIRVRNESRDLSQVDVTECDLIERPLLESYELIQEKDLRPLLPNELSDRDFRAFFDRSQFSWKPYAANLPWSREGDSDKKLLAALRAVAEGGSSENTIQSIISESGAGGTTLSRMLAFKAATEGYPTLIARAGLNRPEALELSRFLFRAHQKIASASSSGRMQQNAASPNAVAFEVPWLVVFDVSHWEGRQAELRAFLGRLTTEGRSVVILAVNDPFVPVDLQKSSIVKRIANLSHELSLSEVQKLGEHLNPFLQPLGRQRRPQDWEHFWQAHRPNHLTSSISHFWIALEFWLKGQLDLNESIQSWIYRSFVNSDISDDVRIILLEIAAMSIERQPLPEGLIPQTTKHQHPYSVLLEEARLTVPALALVREAADGQKIWAMAHDLLGRYLITSLFYDHPMLERLGLQSATDPVKLRLMLLRRIACSHSISTKAFRWLAIDFAVKILKLDAEGNQEFVASWRDVLEILNSMPAEVRETSRAFNHHLAVSLRRVAKQSEFNLTPSDQKQLLESAIKHLEYALHDLPPGSDGESDLNLYNSLALAYQDMADVELGLGAPANVIDSLREKATEATRNALIEDPTNSFVLETTAKNLIQKGEHTFEEAASSGAEALGYIYQAMLLEHSQYRQATLTRLSNRALNLLRSAGGENEVKRLIQASNPLGNLAEAWLLLTEGIADLQDVDLLNMPASNVQNALAALDNSKEKANWLILRFRYDLLSVNRKEDFRSQLAILDELDGTGYRMPLQLQLEHAILLHQMGRHLEGNRKFRNLRQSLWKTDAIVEVPRRLFWLVNPETGAHRVLEASVVENMSHRSIAKVAEFKDEQIPFIPQEFGVQNLRSGMRFKCSVSFGRKGPFLKPPQSA